MLSLLLMVILVLLVAGVLLWAVSAFPWVDPSIKQAIRVLVIVVIAIWLIYLIFGFMVSFPVHRL